MTEFAKYILLSVIVMATAVCGAGWLFLQVLP